MIYAADLMDLDTDHRELLWLAGSLTMAAHQQDDQMFSSVFLSLLKSVRQHFAQEQALLEHGLGAVAAQQHIAEHKALLLLFQDSAQVVMQKVFSWERRYSISKVLEDCLMREITESDPYLLHLVQKRVVS